MATVNYITPITNRTQADVEYARQNQHDLTNKNIGAWNYTDLNRICNNLKYAAEYMYEQGFLNEPYSMQVKLNWTETDILTYETLNTMIVQTMNNLKTYSRPDLNWYPIASIANMDYTLANAIERNIHAMATQVPMPPDKYTLEVENGTGSGEYEPRTIVTIRANPAEEGMVFSYWSGDHLENIGSSTAMITTYQMPYENIKLKANYTSAIPHTLKVVTYTSTTSKMLYMGSIHYIEADPAPQDKVFHHWDVQPSEYADRLYEPAATTHFTMPNEDVTLTAVYITRGEKQLKVINGNGSGYYEYDTYASISSSKPSGATFTQWTGDTQYLTGPVTQEYNSVKIPDVNVITVRANWSIPPVTGVKLTVVNGVISSSGETEGAFTEGNRITIVANTAPAGYVFAGWSHSGGGYVSGSGSTATMVIGTTAATVTATYRQLEYYTLTVNEHSGTTTKTLEKYDYFSVDANPYPTGYTFDSWSGDTHTFNQYSWQGFDTTDPTTGTYMGGSNRTITANYRLINPHTLTVKQLSGDVTYQQAEFTTVTVTAEDAPEGKRFVRWNVSGAGTIPWSQETSKTVTYTFGNGNGTLTPVYVNIWTITVIDGTIDGKTTAILDEGSTYRISCRNLLHYEGFGGWTKNGPGSISNTAATSTYFTVGAGNTTLTANVIEYPDKTLTIYWRHPDTNADTLVSRKTYKYGSKITGIEAEIAPNKSTFLTWLGDVNPLSPSALASTVTINSLTTDVTIIATYYYPESPEYYTLTVYNGYPEEGEYAAGSQVTIRANEPSQGWEFHTWYGDTQYIVNQEGLQDPVNSVIMPKKAITLRAKFKEEGELALWSVSVSNGIAKATYFAEEAPEEGEEDTREAVTVEGDSILVPEGTEVILVADEDTVGYEFAYWQGNFEAAGVKDIVTTERETRFTMPRADMNIQMVRGEKDKCIIYPTNATAPSEGYVGNVYDIKGNLRDSDDYKYQFEGWTCVDADGNSYIQCIEDPSETGVVTKITIPKEEYLWLTAEYTTKYRLTVVKGQNKDEEPFYAENEIVNSIFADAPTPESRTKFDHWDDPMGVVKNIYDETPTIIMKNTVATITAVYTSIDAYGNSVVMTGDEIDDELIYRTDSYLINGLYSVGALVFDKEGCLGVLTKVDPDETDDTDDFEVKKFFYGGNF